MYGFNIFSCSCHQELEGTAMSARLWITQIMFMKLGWVFLFCICIWMCVIYSTACWFKPCLKTVFPQLLSAMTASRYILTGRFRFDYIVCSRFNQSASAYLYFNLTAASKGSLKVTILGFTHSCTIQGKLCAHTLVPRFAEVCDTRVTTLKAVCSS